MDRLSASFTRDEVSRIFDLPPETIDSLLSDGRLLCSVVDGEPRVPLEQAERYLRDALLRLYRTAASRIEEVADTVAGSPFPLAEEAEQQAAADDEQPEPAPIVPASPPPARVDKPTEDEQVEFRRSPRYIPRRQIDGIFSDVRFTIVQISTSGLRIRHDLPLAPGDEAKVSFALLNPPRSFVMRARVVWTSVARFESGGESFCISGIRVIDHAERLARAIEILRSTHDLQPDRRSKPRPEVRVDTLATALEGISDDEVALVVQAAQRFASDPLEANRWYSRARFALADEQVRREAPRKPRDREEVLGIWEYLERKVEMGKVAGVLSWVKHSKAAAV